MASTPASTSSSTTATRSIRPHRKSRTGCRTCKRRKVKCDEQRPCGNCKSFGVACDLAPEAFLHAPSPAASVKRRGRGRPRKDWSLNADKQIIENGCLSTPATPSLDSAASTPSSLVQGSQGESLDINQAELLLHFIHHTSTTLAGEEGMVPFWSQNAPRISLDHPFVLHLIEAIAAYHLAYASADSKRRETKSPNSRRSRSEYLSLASRHFTAGLSGFTAQLSHSGPDNCGPLYLGAVLTTYCTFASGPTSPDDLLVCTLAPSTSEEQDPSDDQAAAEPCTWMPFVYGVRLLHDLFSPNVLFAGLMEPLQPYKGVSPEEPLGEPVCVRDGYQRLDWEDACLQLSEWVGGGDNDPCRLAMDSLLPIYAATYGYSEVAGRIHYEGASANQFVFGWLYRLNNAFLQCVRRREPRALLVLAYYAVLLNKDTVQQGWYIEGWRSHIIDRVGRMLGEKDGHQFMQWPEQVEQGDV